MKKLHRVPTFKNDPAEIILVSTAVVGRMHREVIFTRHSIAIIIHFSLETEKKIIRTTDTYLCLSVSSLWTNLASSRMCDWNRNSLPLFGGRSKLYHPCSSLLLYIQVGLCQNWSEILKTDFLSSRLICRSYRVDNNLQAAYF